MTTAEDPFCTVVGGSNDFPSLYSACSTLLGQFWARKSHSPDFTFHWNALVGVSEKVKGSHIYVYCFESEIQDGDRLCLLFFLSFLYNKIKCKLEHVFIFLQFLYL